MRAWATPSAPLTAKAFEALTDELLDVMVNGRPIAKGEIVAQGNRFALRIVEIAGDTGPAAGEAELG